MNTFVPDKRPRLSRHVRLHTDKVSGAPVLLLPETIIVLNQTGYDILGSKYSADRLTLSRGSALSNKGGTISVSSWLPEQTATDVFPASRYKNPLVRSKNGDYNCFFRNCAPGGGLLFLNY